MVLYSFLYCPKCKLENLFADGWKENKTQQNSLIISMSLDQLNYFDNDIKIQDIYLYLYFSFIFIEVSSIGVS